MSSAAPPRPPQPGPIHSSENSRLPSEALRLSMSRVIAAWAFGAVFVQLTAGAVYASFARQLGVSEATFGFLAGVFPLMGVLQVPAARLLERGWSPRRMMLAAGLSCRGLWVVAATLPLWASVEILPREWMLPGFVGCLVLSGICQAFTGPAFFVWMSALVPGRVGPSFWSKRQQVGTIVAIFAVLIGGAIADQAGAIKEWSNGEVPPLMLYSILLTIAAVCGVLDIALFFKVQEPPALHLHKDTETDNSTKTLGPTLWASLLEPLRVRQVRNYLIFTAVSMVGFASTGPLLWLHCLEVFEWNKKETGMLLTIAPLLGMACTSRYWGQVLKTYGTRPVARFASLGMVVVPVAWLVCTKDTMWPMAIILVISGALFMAYDLCNINFITRSCPELPRPTLTALFAIGAGTTFALTSWGSGVAAEWLHGWRLELWGREFINYHLIFLFSLVPRLLNAFVFSNRLEEPSSTPTREAVREIGHSLAAAFTARFTRLFGARQE